MTIDEICIEYNITNYTINDDGSIDVNGDVDLYNCNLTELPLVFNKVSGWFDCGKNRLTSLEFCPDYVGNWFSCESNQLTNNYCDTEIGVGFHTTLKQDGLIINNNNKATNYNEWRKLYKRKLILDELYKKNM